MANMALYIYYTYSAAGKLNKTNDSLHNNNTATFLEVWIGTMAGQTI